MSWFWISKKTLLQSLELKLCMFCGMNVDLFIRENCPELIDSVFVWNRIGIRESIYLGSDDQIGSKWEYDDSDWLASP